MGRRATRKRRRHGGAPGGSAAVRDKIARGRTKSALEDAKRLARDAPGPASEAVLGEAYVARIEALAGGGLHAEAGELLEVARQRLPELASRLETVGQALALRSGDLGELLRTWGCADTPRARRAEIAELLETGVVDLASIAAAVEFDPDDPLRRAAGALQRAFVEATAGRLSESARVELRAVPRRSPLVAWRSLTLAIAAFHDGDDDAAHDHLGRVPQRAAVRPLADLLQGRVEDGVAAGSGPAARGLLERLGVSAHGERDALARLRTALARDDDDEACIAASSLLDALRKTDRRLALRFARWAVRRLDEEHDRLGASLRAFGGDWPRLVALDLFEDAGSLAFAWMTWLMPEPGGPLRRLDDAELALVLDRLAPAVGALLDEWSWSMGMVGLGDRAADLSTAAGLEQLASLMMAWMGEEDPASVLPFMIAHLVRCLEQRVEPSPFRWRSAGARLQHFAVELDPAPERFRVLCGHADELSVKERKALLELWAKRLPDDVEPIMRLLDHAEQRSAHRQATAYLERAERLAPVDTGVRAARFRVLLFRLHAHLRLGKAHLCARDLADLEAAPAAASPERTLYLRAARCRVAVLAGHGQEEARRELYESCPDRLAAERVLELVDVLSERGALDMTMVPRGARVVAVVLLLLRVLRAVAPRSEFARPGSWLVDCTAEHLPSDPADLALLCAVLTHPDDGDLLHLCSGLGLLQDGAFLPRFLMYRWQALRTGERWTEAAEEVRRLALALAYRYQDREVARELREAAGWHPFLDTPDPAGDSESAAWLGRERALQGRLRDRAADVRRDGLLRPAKRSGGPKRGRKRGDRTRLLPFPGRAGDISAEEQR